MFAGNNSLQRRPEAYDTPYSQVMSFPVHVTITIIHPTGNVFEAKCTVQQGLLD